MIEIAKTAKIAKINVFALSCYFFSQNTMRFIVTFQKYPTMRKRIIVAPVSDV